MGVVERGDAVGNTSYLLHTCRFKELFMSGAQNVTQYISTWSNADTESHSELRSKRFLQNTRCKTKHDSGITKL